MIKPLLHSGSVCFDNSEEIWPTSAVRAKYENLQNLSRRSLLMAKEGDTIVIDRRPAKKFLEILKQAGAGGDILIGTDPDDISNHARNWSGDFCFYMIGKSESRLLENLNRDGWPGAELVQLLNNKIFFQRTIEDAGLPCIYSFISNCDAVAHRVQKHRLPFILRAGASIGGSGVYVATCEQERKAVLKILAKSDKKKIFLLSDLLPVKTSPNLQYYLDGEQAFLFSESIQIIKNHTEHKGNLFEQVENKEQAEELRRQGSIIAKRCMSLGLKGIIGIDFIISGGKIYPVELNARQNSSTCASWFLNRLFTGDRLMMPPSGRSAYLSISVERNVTWDEVAEMLSENLFDPETKRGILPIDTMPGTTVELVISANNKEQREKMISLCYDTSRPLV